MHWSAISQLNWSTRVPRQTTVLLTMRRARSEPLSESATRTRLVLAAARSFAAIVVTTNGGLWKRGDVNASSSGAAKFSAKSARVYSAGTFASSTSSFSGIGITPHVPCFDIHLCLTFIEHVWLGISTTFKCSREDIGSCPNNDIQRTIMVHYSSQSSQLMMQPSKQTYLNNRVTESCFLEHNNDRISYFNTRVDVQKRFTEVYYLSIYSYLVDLYVPLTLCPFGGSFAMLGSIGYMIAVACQHYCIASCHNGSHVKAGILKHR